LIFDRVIFLAGVHLVGEILPSEWEHSARGGKVFLSGFGDSCGIIMMTMFGANLSQRLLAAWPATHIQLLDEPDALEDAPH